MTKKQREHRADVLLCAVKHWQRGLARAHCNRCLKRDSLRYVNKRLLVNMEDWESSIPSEVCWLMGFDIETVTKRAMHSA